MPELPRFRLLLRRILRTPGFSALALLTLAVGIGANAAVFSVVRGVLLEPLPYPEPQRLVGLWHEAPGLDFDTVNQSPATYLTYREQGEIFVDVGLWDNSQSSITGIDQPEEVETMLVSDGTLPLLGAEPVRGRSFTPEDDSPDSPRTVMLGYDYWQKRFGGGDVLGETLRVDGEAWEIIGVLPRGFRLLDRPAAIYLPFRIDRSEVRMGNFSYQALARLKDGVTLEQANAEVARLIPVAVEEFPGGLTLENLREARFGPKVRPLEIDVVGDIGPTLWVLLGTVGLVLLIACANVANLFLVRSEGRQVELAVRQAMGADRRTIAVEQLGETLALAFAGGALGLGLAEAGLRLLRALGPRGLPRLQEIQMGPQVLLATAALALLTGLLLGLLPALRRGPALTTTLREGGRGASTGKQRLQARSALVVAQVAIALVLLVGAGLLLRSFDALRRVEPGFQQPEDVLTVRLSLTESQVPELPQVVLAHEQMFQALGAIPGVTAIGASSSMAMDGWDSNDALYIQGFEPPEGQLPPIRRFKWITEGYFEMLERPLLAGRTITWADIHDRAPVAVVTKNLALEYWDSPSQALGKLIRNQPEKPWRRIVGVVGDVHDDGVDRAAVETVYWPMAMRDFWQEELLVRRSMSYGLRFDRPIDDSVMGELQRTIWAVNPDLPLANLATLDELLDRSLARTSFTLVMLGVAAGVALLLGLVGIFGVVSYTTAQRTREIGVRMALGARGADVRALVLRQAMLLAAAGVGLGLVAAFGLTRSMSALLFGVEAIDPLTYGAVALLLTAFALLSSYLPARRAARLDPNIALRQD